ncbi:MAG: plastocyanin/azurin family copper-binding protein [Verrucomicrobiaceae bacterium]
MKKFLFAAFLAPGLIASAQDATTPSAPAAPAAPATEPAAPLAPSAAKDPSLAELLIKPAADNPMMFDLIELTVKPGQKVKLTFDNPVQPNVQGLPHNWVLVKPGKEAVVGNAALAMAADPKAMQKSYIPAGADGGAHADILAHTTLVQPGTKTELEFTAPAEAGDYPYICTFPGHFLLMKGTLHVK